MAAPCLRCTRCANFATFTTTRSWRPSPISSFSSLHSTEKNTVRPSTLTTSTSARAFIPTGGSSDVAHVEHSAEALVALGQQILYRGERRRFDEIDHHRRRQHCDSAAADARAVCSSPTTSSAMPESPARIVEGSVMDLLCRSNLVVCPSDLVYRGVRKRDKSPARSCQQRQYDTASCIFYRGKTGRKFGAQSHGPTAKRQAAGLHGEQ